jgi:hypothetical protein
MATKELDDGAKRDVRAEFGDAVDMTAAQLKKWLATDESRSVAVLADELGPRPAEVGRVGRWRGGVARAT